jgi:CDP-glycerol glycerophosphotransferase (TagB/SpsB family)
VCTGFVGYHSTGASELENLLMLESVLDWARQRPDIIVVHKLHPGEEPSYYREVLASLGWTGLRSVRDAVLYDLVEQSDVLVAAYSTTVLEAAALGTPAIVLDAITKCHALPLDESPDITIASSVPELGAALDRIREGRNSSTAADEARRAFLENYLFKLDGHATERVAALLISGT